MARTERTERMISQAPDYYETSKVFEDLQAVIAGELDRAAANDADLRLQFSPSTATWGLEHYEKELQIPVVESDSIPIRRSRVIAKERGPGNYSAALIKSVCEAFSGGEVGVAIDAATYAVTVTFIGVRGIPENLEDLKHQVGQIIHAHIGVEYEFTYLTFGELEPSVTTFGDLDASGMTFGDMETWKP